VRAGRSAAKKRITSRNRASETCELFEYLFFIADQGLIPHQHPINYIRPLLIPLFATAADISWFEAAAYVNWLNTSKGYAPAYNLTWTNGAWSMALWPTSPDTNGNVAWTNGGTNLYRNASCTYFLPSENEWYKAAYYDPTKNGGSGGYWLYPTGSDSPPTPVASGTNAGTAVYYFDNAPASVFQSGGLSPYGTMGQGGNVWSFTETSWSTSNTDTQEARVMRGGGGLNLYQNMTISQILFLSGQLLQPGERSGIGPDNKYETFKGFRVARKP
jgi:formylglycine-generating enzyme required for sulfatase activity